MFQPALRKSAWQQSPTGKRNAGATRLRPCVLVQQPNNASLGPMRFDGTRSATKKRKGEERAAPHRRDQQTACHSDAVNLIVSAMLSARSLWNGRRCLPGWLALFAIAVQLAVSFGHTHPEDYRFLLRGHGAPVLSAGDFQPGQSTPALPADSDCPICASVFMLGNAPMPMALALPVPHGMALAVVAAGEALWLTLPRHLLFVTRGPPLI